ncbi:hypothetical protein TNCV_3271721 [Trichonephila clavipes]|nr:hypothetical protein TNCV_3271721 [Trichonephila clavipes]
MQLFSILSPWCLQIRIRTSWSCRQIRDSLVKTIFFHSAAYIVLSPHHWFFAKGRLNNGRLVDRPLCCKRCRMFQKSLDCPFSWAEHPRLFSVSFIRKTKFMKIKYYAASKRPSECLFGLGAFGKIKSQARIRIARAQVPPTVGGNWASKLPSAIGIHL